MLLINKTGRIYDVPEQIADQYVATRWSASSESIDELLSTLRKPASGSPELPNDSCCKVYANYCPER